MPRAKKLPLDCEYFDHRKHWRKLQPIFESDEIKEASNREMNSFKLTDYHPGNRVYRNFRYPEEYDNSDWRFERGRGRPANYLRWVCSRSCHWSAIVNLQVLWIYQPEIPWCLVTSRDHSTVWDGHKLIFDMQYYALTIPINELVEIVNSSKNREIYPPGISLIHFPEESPDYETANWVD
ncbi:MAG: hypothetical protein RLZZ69_1681 [Cyanobacteriota bacterium]